MGRTRQMHIVAAPISGAGRETLELVVCLDPSGRLDASVPDTVPQRCRLLYDGREEWAGTLRMDEGRWIVHSDLGDDEPIRSLHVHSLRPGEHLTLCGPGAKQVTFRVQHVA